MSCLIFFTAEQMPVSPTLTCVPEKRGEVQSEHKLSASLCAAGTKYSPGGLSPLGFRFIFSCVGAERGEGRACQRRPPAGLWAGSDPSTPGHGGPAAFLWEGSSGQLQAGCVWKSLGTWCLRPQHYCGCVDNQANSPNCFKTSCFLSSKMLEIALGKFSHLAGYVRIRG